MGSLPSPLRGLFRDDDETPAETGHEPATTTEISGAVEPSGAPIVVLRGGRQMTRQDQARAAVWHACRVAWRHMRALSRREGGLINGLLTAHAPSVMEQHEYAESRVWVHPGHEGGFADVAGTIFHIVIGRPGVAFGNLVAGVCARPRRFIPASLTFLACVIALAIWLS
jgi:hypothetical protein